MRKSVDHAKKEEVIASPLGFKLEIKVGELLTALLNDFSAAIQVPQHRDTIRALKTYQSTLRRVSEYLAESTQQPPEIAEEVAARLCAAQLVAERTIGVDQKKQKEWVPAVVDEEAKKSEIPIFPYGAPDDALQGLPFDTSALKRWLKMERKSHRKFIRKSKAVLKTLKDYCGFLKEECPDLLFTMLNRQALTHDLDTFHSAVVRHAKDRPRLYGTRLQHPWDQLPHNLAGVEIFKLLRERSLKLQALGDTVNVLGFAFPDTPMSEEGLWQACLRSNKPSTRKGSPRRKPKPRP